MAFQWDDIPTLAVVSVRLFSVVDLPLEGLPTRPMRGSRGIVEISEEIVMSQVGAWAVLNFIKDHENLTA